MSGAVAGSVGTQRPSATRPATPALAALGWALVAGAIFLVVPYVAVRAGLATERALLAFDPDQVFIYLWAHHAAEAALGLALLALCARPFLTRVRGWGDVRFAARTIAIFTVVVAALAFVANDLPVLLGGAAPTIYPLNARNMAGILAFQFVIVGFGEELFFRGAILGVLSRVFGRRVRLVFFHVSIAGLITAALFGLEHGILYDFGFWPMSFVPSWLQVGWAFVLGVYYAALTERTKSLAGAIVSHNISDVLVLFATWAAVAH